MHEIERLDDVTRVRLRSRAGALTGYDVSVYYTRGVLVDTGFPRAARRVAQLAGEWRPRGAIVTHWHEDHAGNAGLLARLGVPLRLDPRTLAQLRERPRIRLYRRVVWGRPPVFPDAYTAFDDDALVSISTPGHTDDHHVVWDAERRTLFSGDLWLGVRSRLMHEHESPHRIVVSLRRVLALEPARMFDAHRGPVPNPARALRLRIDFLEDAISRISRRVREGWPDGEIVRDVLEGEEMVGRYSFGEYSRTNFVRAVRRHLEEETR